jgi:SAM-dependent methyltransferase
MAPGSILQQMYVLRRLRQWGFISPTFYEMGSGDGYLSKLLLEQGFTGRGFDLNAEANKFNRVLNADSISAGNYEVEDGSFIEREGLPKVDLILSSMVIEHLEASLVAAYFTKAKSLLREGGRLVTLVPAGMFAWGVEDDVAGHVKRYERECFKSLAVDHGLHIENLAGLTWPLSNMLLPVSNFLVHRAESRLLDKSMLERTVASGHRDVQFKTTFPWWTRLLLNRLTMLPWHGLQLLGKDCTRALILYCEMANVAA